MRKIRQFLLIFILLASCFVLGSCELIYEAKNGKPSVKRVNILVYGNDYANSKYEGGAVNPLYGTVNDATQVGLALETLAEKAGLECNAKYILGKNTDKKGVDFKYDISNAITSDSGKLDTDTTMSHFRAILEDLALKSTDEDINFIYFSCHGIYDSEVNVKAEYGSVSSSTYFAMSANTGDEIEKYSHELFLEDIKEIKGIKVVLADVCHSGGFVNPSYVSVNSDEYLNIDAATLFFEGEKIDVDSSLYCLSAARYYEQSYEHEERSKNNRTHGNFTIALLEALGWDGEKLEGEPKAMKNGKLTFHNLVVYVAKNDNDSRQNPMFNSGSNDVILFSF